MKMNGNIMRNMSTLMQCAMRLANTTSFRTRSLQKVLYSTATEVEPSPEAGEPDTLLKRLEIELRAPEPEAMRAYSQFARMAANELGIMVGKCWTPLKHAVSNRQQGTVLSSAFAKKDYRTQYEVRTYFRYMTFHHLTGSTADTFLEYIERNLPESVAMKITKVSVERMPEEITRIPLLEANKTETKESDKQLLEEK